MRDPTDYDQSYVPGIDWSKVVWNIRPDYLECLLLIQERDALAILDVRGTQLGYLNGTYYSTYGPHREIYDKHY